MPLDENDKKAIQDMLASQATALENQFGGMAKRIASEVAESKLKDFKPIEPAKPPAPEVPKPEAPKPGNESALKAEIDAIKKNLENKEKEAALLSSVHAKRFFDPKDLTNNLLPKIVKRDDGSYVVPGKKKLEQTGQEIETDLSIEEAISSFMKEKPHYVRGEPRGGTGAGEGQPGAEISVDQWPKTYEEAMKSSKMIATLTKTPEGQAHLANLRRNAKK